MADAPVSEPDIVTTNGSGMAGIIANIKSTFKNEALKGFYDAFYTIFLTKANSLPLNCQWVVWMDAIPWKTIESFGTSFVDGWNIFASTETAHNIINDSKKGMILAQSVQAVGEGINVQREGTPNTGMVQGYIGTGRKPFPLLKVAFFENNVSFVDYVIRPWIVAVSHKSLKNPYLKTNLNCWWLSRTGPRNNLAIRKRIVYHNCCPVSIAEEEFNYTGDDIAKRRSVEFAYTHYTVENADKSILAMIADSTNGFWAGLGKKLIQDLQRQFGANNPSQYINNLIDKAQQFGKDMITSTVSRAVSNVAGNVSEVVNDAVNGATGAVMSAQNRGLDNLNDMVTDGIDSLLGRNGASRGTTASRTGSMGNRSSFNTALETSRNGLIDINRKSADGQPLYTEKKVNDTDTPYYLQKIESLKKDAPTPPPEMKVVPVNDTPTHTKLPSDTDINSNDAVTMLTPLKYKIKKTNPNDARNNELIIGGKPINQNDTVDRKSIKFDNKLINQNDVRNRPSLQTGIMEIIPNKDDDKVGKNINYTNVTTNGADDKIGKNITYKHVVTPENDSNTGKNIRFKIV